MYYGLCCSLLDVNFSHELLPPRGMASCWQLERAGRIGLRFVDVEMIRIIQSVLPYLTCFSFDWRLR